MKKNVISLSIAALLAGFAGSALAAGSVPGLGDPVRTNPAGGTTNTVNARMHLTTATNLQFNGDGIGHMLLVPYYTAQNGNATLLSLTNTDTVNGKAVKIRFREAANSDDVLDFQIYLSPGDVWTAEISQSTNGEAQITFNDKSCTAPESVSGTKFTTFRFEDAPWGSAEKLAHTREGYVEIFNMADIPPTLASDMKTANPLFRAVKHVNGVAPCRSYAGDPISALHQNTNSYLEWELETLGLDTPTTGLMGTAVILNRLTGYVSWTDNAEAVVAVDATGAAAAGRNVFARQNNNNIGIALAEVLTDDPLLRRQTNTYTAGIPAVTGNPVANPVEWDFPDMSTPYITTLPLLAYSNTWAIDVSNGDLIPGALAPLSIAPWDQVAALTDALAVSSVVNEFTTDPAIGASTDWTFSMPTRRYHVAMDYAGKKLVFNNASAMRHDAGTYWDGTGTDSTSRYFTAGNVTATSDLYACLSGISIATTGREEQTSSGPSGEGVSPGGGTSKLQFCGEVSLVGFHGTDTLYGSTSMKYDVAPSGGYRDGWAIITTPGAHTAGLPILGAAYSKLVGEDVGTKSTNYGVHIRHRYTR